MQWQIELLQWIQQFQNPVLDIIFNAITATAEETFFIVVAGWILWCHNKELGQRVGFGFLTSTAFNPILKNIIRFERPIGVEGIVSQRTHTAGGFSFPSGHTQGATSFWTGMITSCRRRWVTILGSVMIFLVALSRMYLGVHWLTDVLGGLIFGIGWILLANRIFDYARNENKLWILGLLLLPLFIGFLAVSIQGGDKALTVSFATSLGFWLGFMLEDRYIQFKVKNRWYFQLLKLVLGLGILMGIRIGLKAILPFPALISDLIRYTVMGFWISGGAFSFFKLLKLDGELGTK